MKISGCETCDPLYIEGGPDMIIQLNYSLFIAKCNQIWEQHGICGTYLEVHKSLNKDIIYQGKRNYKNKCQLNHYKVDSIKFGLLFVVRQDLSFNM